MLETYLTEHRIGSYTPKAGVSPPSSNPVYTVRTATAGDVDGICDLGRRVWTSTFAHTTTEANMAAYLESAYSEQVVSEAISSPHRRFLIATPAAEPKVVAGFAILATDSTSSEPSVSTWPNPIELQRIYVDPAYHGGGVARMLTEAAYALGREEGYKSVWLGVLPENQRAVRFYEKCGFVRVGEHEFRVGDQIDIDAIMTRLL